MVMRRMRGFTLVETLVTLVIVALITALVAEGLFHIARIERSLQGEQAAPRLEALHEQWVVLALKGLIVADPAIDAPFHGGATAISGQSTMAPVAKLQGPVPLTLALEAGDSSTRLWVETAAYGSEPGARTVLAEWPWADVHWVYQDQRGRLHAEWPPENPPADEPVLQALPSLIRLEADQGRRVLLVAAPANNYMPWVARPATEDKL